MRRWGKGEILSAVPVADPKSASLTSQVEVKLAPTSQSGAATITMEREILDRFADGQTFGGFQGLKFETEADKRRTEDQKRRENSL